MAINQETFNNKLYDLLKTRGYNPVPKDSQNKRTTPKKADVFNFTFTKNGKSYGDSWVTIDDASNIIVYYDEEQYDSPEGKTSGLDYDDSWTGFLKHLKNWAMKRQLSFELAPKNKLGDDMARREETKQEALNEGYYPINKTASYSDAVPTVKIVLQHTRQIHEGEQRFRNIAKIFLENEQGERILAPTTRPGIARVYARHLAEGGLPHDDRWNHIGSLVEEYTKMAGFVRATRHNQFNESALKLVEAGMNHYVSLRETLGKLTGHRGYNSYFESYTPPLMEDDTDSTTINELFVQETLDPRIESVMPILNKLQKQLGEMSEVKELDEWADNIVNEKMDSTTKSLAVPADKMLDEAPGAETLAHNQNTEKSNLKAFDLAEEEKMAATQIKKRLEVLRTMLAKEKDFDEQKTIKQEIEGLINKAKELGYYANELKTTSKPEQPVKNKMALEPTDSEDTRAGDIVKISKQKSGSDSDKKYDTGADLMKTMLGLFAEGEDDAEAAHKKSQVPAYMRKASGDPDWKTTTQDLEKAKERSISGKEGLAALTKRLGQLEEEEVHEEHDNLEVGQMMARDGIEYERGKEKELIKIMGDYMSKMGMSDKQIRNRFWTDEDFIADQLSYLPRAGEREVEESGLQAYLGNKKYGKEGMDALRKAGREGASKEKMASIRAKYDKLDEEGVAEDLDANQKRVGQLGPTEKVGPKGAVGKLVGTSESVQGQFGKRDPVEMERKWKERKEAHKKYIDDLKKNDPEEYQRYLDKLRSMQKEEMEEQGVAEGSMDEANIQPSSARSRSHIGNLSDPVTNSVVHPSSGKEIGIITMQPSGEYYAQHTASPLAQAQFGTFATKDEAHQFIRNAHAKAMKDGTLSNKWLKAPPMPQFAKEQEVAEGQEDLDAILRIIRR